MKFAIFCVLVLCWFLLTGKTRDTEETVCTDFFTGSARKREFPEREKQSARHASKGIKNYLHADIVNLLLYVLEDALLKSAGEREVGIFGRKVRRVV